MNLKNLFDSFKTFFRKLAGYILIVLGLLGSLIPIPFVPFFLLALVGINMVGDTHPRLKKLKEKLLQLKNKLQK
jgi:uncharacterized membrane protein YbaN (DUF454 family)